MCVCVCVESGLGWYINLKDAISYMTQKVPIAVVAMKSLLNQGSVPGDGIKSSVPTHMYTHMHKYTTAHP